MGTSDPSVELIRRWYRQCERALHEQVSLDQETILHAWRLLAPPGKRTLDLGCGTGVLTLFLARAMPEQQFIGVDRNSSYIAIASDSARTSMVKNLSYAVGDASSLWFSDGSFDAVWIRSLLQHVPSPPDVLAECMRVLRPGGRLLVWEGDESLLVSHPPAPCLHRLAAVRNRFIRNEGGDPAIGRKLPNLLRRAGFIEIKSEVVIWNSIQPGKRWLLTHLALDTPGAPNNPLITKGFISAPEYAELVVASRRFVESSHSLILIGSVVVTGTRPSPNLAS